MNDANFKKTQARLLKAAGKWHHILGLDWWHVDYEWAREGIAREDQASVLDNRKVAGTCQADWKYKDAVITFNVPMFADMSDDDLERVVVHEQVHILVNQMRESGIEHEERTVSDITSALFWVANATAEKGWGKPLKVTRKAEA